MLSDEHLDFATLKQLRIWFIEGELTPSDYLDFCLSRIERINPKINAVLDVYDKTARPAALAATQRYADGKPRSDIDGMPIGVKANISVRGYVCHGGIKAYDNNIATHDADIVHRLRRAGAVIIGSLNMEEGALGAQTDNPWFGKCYNPLKDGYTSGGSSGGSAAAVAAGMMPASLGTDTMGSVRIPSAYCGLVGFKPGRQAYSTQGVMPLSTTLDSVGTHTRTVQDAIMIYKAVTGFKNDIDPRAPKTLSPFDISSSDVEPDIAKAFTSTIETLEVSTTAPILSDYDFSKQRRAGLIVSEYEGAKFHAGKDFETSEGFSAHFKSMLSFGQNLPTDKVNDAYARTRNSSKLAESFFQNTQALIAPAALQTAFKFGDDVPANQADFTAFANFADLPAISLPMGAAKNGLPMGLQLMTKSGRDRALLGMALWYENMSKAEIGHTA